MTEVTAVYGDDAATFRRVQALLGQAGAQLSWDEPSEGASYADMLTSAKRTGLALVGHQRWRGEGLAPAVVLRDELGVFAQERPIRPVPGLPGRHGDVDLVVVRETTEDVYAHLEHESIPQVFESLKVTTEQACERIARHAFEMARASGRPSVTVVHKANIMKLSDGMFLRTAKRVAEDYTDVACNDVIVDALCMRLVLDPGAFDVLLCGNLFGDIVADLCAGLVGGASNAPSINHASDGTVLFTAGHGDEPQTRGTEDASPLPVLLPSLHLLRHVGQGEVADKLHTALAAVLEGGVRPVALGGEAGLEAFCEAIAGKL
ncbi:MAG: NAD-dependent isocitrate dehydrogenase [Myxococcales bacterium]|nr:NAD-dependent isocitrate dehydrogenase [Myxococcales bacterium]